MAKKKRQRLPLLYLLLGGLAAVAVLDLVFGHALQKWFASTYTFDTPLLGSALLLLIIAIVPFVILVNLGEDDDKGES